MASSLSSLSVGSPVKLNVSGTPRNFIVVHQGLPGYSYMYDSTCDGTWLLMEDIDTTGYFGANYKYTDSNVATYLSNTFLPKLDADVQTAIKTVYIPYAYGETVHSGPMGFECKAFLLSAVEVGFTSDPMSFAFPADGETLSYFYMGNAADTSRVAKLNGVAKEWWLRTSELPAGYNIIGVSADGAIVKKNSSSSTTGIRPALILPSDYAVDDDGMLLLKHAPGPPGGAIPNISLPNTIRGGDVLTLSWGASTDADGDLAGYRVEVTLQNNGGGWTKIYDGPDLSVTYTVPIGSPYITVRAYAYDREGLTSSYAMSRCAPVTNNTAPVITCVSTALGELDEGFTVSYTVSDAEANAVTVTESIDGATAKTHTPELNGECLFDVTGLTFLKLLNAAHTLRIDASDGELSGSHEISFTKNATTATITSVTPQLSAAPISMCSVKVTGSLPTGTILKVEVTNNAGDTEPVWEDATGETRLGWNHLFKNTQQTNGWSFNFRITAQRGTGTGGNITMIESAFH